MVQLLFVLTAALFDASIACWSGKYKFNKPRPITAANKYPKDLVQSLLSPTLGIPDQLELGRYL